MEIRQLIITLFLSCFYNLSCHSQFILDREHNMPRIGDKLPKVSLMDIDYSSKEIDLRGKVLDNHEQTVEFFAKDDSSTCCFSKIDDGTIYHYTSLGYALCLLGYENNLVQMSFGIPMKLIRYPLMQGDTVCCNFEGTGMYADKLPLLAKGQYTLQGTEAHSIITPDGANEMEAYTLHSFCKISLSDSSANFRDSTWRDVNLDHWHTYVRGYRYPIIETKQFSRKGQVLLAKSWYFPLEAQASLLSDGANEVAREMKSRQLDEKYIGGTPDTGKHYLFSYSPASQSATLEYYAGDIGCDSHLVLASISGITYESQDVHVAAHESKSITFSCARLPLGQYALYVNVGAHQHVEKFNVK